MNEQNMNRRDFVGAAGKGTAAIAAMSSAPAILGAQSPNDTIGVGHIGIGVRGGTLLTQVAGYQNGGGIEGAKTVAVCDVYKPHRDKGIQRSLNPEVKEYIDYTELLSDKNVDVVVIATPDHWHSQMLIDASNEGKDVYIEKGWTRTLEEAKEMRKTVRKNKTIMQLGHQSRGQAAGVRAKQLIDEGLLGPVTTVRTGRLTNGTRENPVYRWYGWYNNYDRPDEKMVVENLDWDQWLGPAPDRDFSMERFWHWRCYWDYGTGMAGDLLSHEIDFVQYVLELGIPDSCACYGFNTLVRDGREIPDTWQTIYGYEKKDCVVTFDCSMNTAVRQQAPEFRGKDALLIFDQIAQSVSTFDVYAEPTSEKYSEKIESGTIPNGKPFMTYDPNDGPDVPSLMQDFFNSIRSRKPAKCNEDQAFIESATLIMSVKSYFEKRTVRWNAEKEEIV